MIVREMDADGRKQGEKVSTLLGVRRVFPIDLKWSVGFSKKGRILLSMPLNPDASTSPLADRPKLSRVAAVAATVAKF